MQVDCWPGLISVILCHHLYDLADGLASKRRGGHLHSSNKDASTTNIDSKLGALDHLLEVFRKRETGPAIEIPRGFAETMSELEGLRRKNTITGLYSELEKYPGLMERRLHVGSHKPQLLQANKRSSLLEVDVARSVCPSRTEWRLIHRARDINDTEVQVFQPEFGASQAHQWFYTVTCMNDHPAIDRECPGCCIGINHNSYVSSCQQKLSYAMALVRTESGKLDWSWIRVNASCNCAIVRRTTGLII